MESDRNEKIRTQVEYYLSDKNLAHDSFFHAKVSEAEDGYIPIDILLKCNKIKHLGVTDIEEVQIAVASSTEVEVKGETIRRKGNKSLPELILLEKKRTRSESKPDKKDPIILSISATPNDVKWAVVKEVFNSSNPDLEAVYLRFNKEDGHMAVQVNGTELNFKDKLTIEGHEFNFKRCEGDELIDFWSKHGSHLEMCLGGKDSRKTKKDVNRLRNPVTIGKEVLLFN